MSLNVQWVVGSSHWSPANLLSLNSKQDWISPSQQPIFANSSSGRVEVSDLLSHFYAGILFGLSLLCMLSQFLWVRMSSWSAVWKILSLWSSVPFGSYNCSTPSSAMISESWEAKFDIGVLLRDKETSASYSLHIGQLRFSVLITICCTRVLLCWELMDELISGT